MCCFYIIDLLDVFYRPSILSVFNQIEGCFGRVGFVLAKKPKGGVKVMIVAVLP